MNVQYLSEIVIAIALLGGLLIAVEVGFRLGRHAPKSTGDPSGSLTGAIQGATLGLLGLLLGFSFAGAAGRYIDRQDLITADANAISTTYLRADLLIAPHDQRLRREIEAYLAHRLEASTRLRAGLTTQDVEHVQDLHGGMWRAAVEGVKETPAATLAVLNPLNEVIDLHSSRVAAGRKHLPGLVLALLVVCAALAVGVIGYGCGLSGNRTLAMTVPLVVVIAAALWTTIDLDHGRIGLIRISDQALHDLRLVPVP